MTTQAEINKLVKNTTCRLLDGGSEKIDNMVEKAIINETKAYMNSVEGQKFLYQKARDMLKHYFDNLDFYELYVDSGFNMKLEEKLISILKSVKIK